MTPLEVTNRAAIAASVVMSECIQFSEAVEDNNSIFLKCEAIVHSNLTSLYHLLHTGEKMKINFQKEIHRKTRCNNLPQDGLR